MKKKIKKGNNSKVVKKNSYKKKIKKITVTKGIAHVLSTFNNTIITITDLLGNTLCWSSPGLLGIKGAKKSTSFSAQIAALSAGKKAINNFGIKELIVEIKGVGLGRESSVRAFGSLGIKIIKLIDVTPIPHNGCRGKKIRRV